MKKSDRKQIGKNIIWNGLSIAISTIINFALTPYVTQHIGIEANGFVTLANTCVTYINIIAVALNAFAARYISMAYHNENYKEANEFYSSVLIADTVLALLLCLPCSAMIWKLEYLLHISDELLPDVKVLFFLLLINWAINVIGTAFKVSAFIKNKTSITYRNKGISSILYAVALGGLILSLEIHVYYVAIANLVAAGFNFYMNFYYAKHHTSKLQIKQSYFSIQKVKKLISSGIWNSINNIGNMLNYGLDLLICNKLLSELIMGQVSVSNQIAKMMTTFTNVFIDAFQPKQLEFYARGDVAELIKYLKTAMKTVGIIGNVYIFCFLVLGKNFFALWLPGQDTQTLYMLSIIVLVGDILVTTVRPLFFVFTLTDKLKSICWITICSGVVNVISMFILISTTGLGGYAVVSTTTVLNLIVHLGITPIFAMKYLNLKINAFYPLIFRHLGVFGITFGLAYILEPYFTCKTWFTFIKHGLILGILSLFFVSSLELTSSEKKHLLQMIKKYLHRQTGAVK